MKTHSVKGAEIEKNWYVVDASGQTLGRLATDIAQVLRGKHKPTFTPHLDTGDYVIVVNSDKIKLTGNKLMQKNYYSYSGYIGGIKSMSAEKMLEKKPQYLIEKAVKGMLPKNKLSRHQMKNLKVYAGEEHPHKAQKCAPFPARVAAQ